MSQNSLEAEMENVRTMTNLLKAIHFKDLATIVASTHGLKVTVEDAKCIQANAFLQSNLFHNFNLTEDQITFKINLSVLIECLSIFGTTPVPGNSSLTALKMCYKEYGSPLTLLLEDGGVLTDCSVKTLEPTDVLDFNFSSAHVLNKIIIKSECLKESFNELDLSAEVLEILMSPDAPYFRIISFGQVGTMQSDFPKDSDMVESFQCTKTQANRYRVSLIKPCIKALNLSNKVSLRTDERGFLSMQFMIKNEDGQISFVEFYCAPDEVQEDDDD